MSDLSKLFSQAKKENILGAEVQIKQVELGHLPKLIELADKVMPDKKGQKFDYMEMAKKLAAESSSDVYDIIAKLTDIEREQVPKMNLGATIMVLHAIVKENADFLSQVVVPEVEKIAESMKKLAGSDKSKP